ncbi:cobalt ABC transporter permease [Methanofollis fontis]|uniref:Cobalt ABC transporter permease n=1 Tax=Methanofollis fontis TaxID=2052832 RepID=A0A483CXE3_9EURY|nr:cobalt ABC transporter permease [Methanofollis fontis]TAJ44549.1 cobalt ABC transporter permease [Methanofollis fontis]
MEMRKPYFTLYQTAILSLCGALVFVAKTFVNLSLHLPGHSYLLVAVPFVFGCGVVRKAGAGAYIGLISGLLASFFGFEAYHIFDILKFLAMGVTIDIVGVAFSHRMDHPVVGFIAGGAGSIVKMSVNYAVHLLLGVPATFILLGIGISSVTHLIFGGIGGVIGALVLARLMRAGVIGTNET